MTPDPGSWDCGHSDSRRWDPGLQPERTASAWTRTTLALAVVALLSTRSRAGVEGLVLGFTALAVTAALTLTCSRRLPRVLRRLHEHGRVPPALGMTAALAGLAGLLPLAALVLFLRP